MAQSERHRDPVDPQEMTLELDGALSIPSGDTVMWAVVLRNFGTRPLVVHTDGDLAAVVVDPDTGATVGGYVGAHHRPLVRFTAKPGRALRIPLLVGTASLTAELGHAVPAGAWQLTVPIDLADGRRLVSRPMAFTVTD